MSTATSSPQNWWRVCFVHGDQTRFYRQLYGGKRAAIKATTTVQLEGTQQQQQQHGKVPQGGEQQASMSTG
jgi:hypothetical protein